jgi:CHAT domain-containing protein
MSFRGAISWRIVAINTATVAVLAVAVLWLREPRPRPNDDGEQFQSIEARLIDERQLPRSNSFTRGGDVMFSPPPELPDDGRLTTMVMSGQTGVAIPKLQKEAEDGDPEALTNLAAALLTHPVANHWPPDRQEISTTLEALVAARKAVARAPALAAAHFNLALALFRLGFLTEARREFEAAARFEMHPAWSAEARRRIRTLQAGRPGEVKMAAIRYVAATAAAESRVLLREYLTTQERLPHPSQWNPADSVARLERAARLYEQDWFPQVSQRLLSQVAGALSPSEHRDLYMHRYLIAGGLHRAGRNREAIAALRMLDADVHRMHGASGWEAQLVSEAAIEKVAANASDEALELLGTAFQRSVQKRESRLAALYADLAREVRTPLLQSAIRDEDLSTALRYTDASVYTRPDTRPNEGEDAREPVRSAAESVTPSMPGRSIRSTGRHLVTYGDLIDSLKQCRQRGLDAKEIRVLPNGPVAVTPPHQSSAEVQRALAANGAIVEYATAHDQVVAFVIRHDEVHAVFLYASAAEVRHAADALRRADDERFAAASRHLYELVLAPLSGRLENVSAIAIVPYPDLAGIPFGALLDVQRGEFFIERVAVTHARSRRAAISASRALKPLREHTLLAIAATTFDHERFPHAAALPAVEREANRIASLSACTRLLVGRDATAESMQRELAENAVIHYAGHIVRRGADAWLPLTPAAGRDGLSATEIARLSLTNARVVVLAACRGASQGEADDILPSMTDAFLTAGVPNVIASSYAIEDADAPATMLRLHTYLRDGDDAATALRKTTIHELQRGRGVPLSLRFMATGGASSLVR